MVLKTTLYQKGATFTKKRKAARKRLLDVANALTGDDIQDDALIVQPADDMSSAIKVLMCS